MAASDHLNKILFNYQVSLDPDPNWPEINVRDQYGAEVGSLIWTGTAGAKYEDWREGNVDHVEVHPALQRKGIATAMWLRAQQAHRDEPWFYPEPTHSTFRSEDGDAWSHSLHARGLSGEVPDNRMDWDEDD